MQTRIISRLVRLGYKRPLTEEDLFDLDESEKCKTVAPIFERCWTEELNAKRTHHDVKYKYDHSKLKIICSFVSHS